MTACGALAGGDAAVAFDERRGSLAGGGGHHDAVERQLGGVADGGLDVALLDRALAVRVERELLDLRPRQRAVGAQPREQQPLGLRRDLHLGGAPAPRAITASRSRASSGKQATAAAAGDFSNSARRASSGRRLPASTIRKPCSVAALDQRLELRGRHAPAG